MSIIRAGETIKYVDKTFLNNLNRGLSNGYYIHIARRGAYREGEKVVFKHRLRKDIEIATKVTKVLLCFYRFESVEAHD